MADNKNMTQEEIDNGEEMTVTLTLDDGREIECVVLTIFPAGGKDYIALLPMDDIEAEDGEVYLYRYSEDENGQPNLENIEDDDEYEIVADAFDELLDEQDHQGVAVVNYTAREVPYTRIIEHKHFEFGAQEKTVITREYPADWKPGDEPYYPINDARNEALYKQYEELAAQEGDVIFAGRLGGYKYYDMDKAIAAAFDLVRNELKVEPTA